MSENKNLLTLEEAARYLGFSKVSLRRWTNDGQLKCHRIGPRGERRFDRKVLDGFLAQKSSEHHDAPTAANARPPAAPELHAHSHQHVCLGYRNPAEQWESFRTYFLDHYRSGAPTTYIYSSSTREDVMQRIRNEGLDANEIVRSGLLNLISAGDSYLRPSEFSSDFMISFVRLIMIRMRAEGHKRHLVTGEMDWHFSRTSGSIDELHIYERKLNRLIDEFPETTIVCQYDTSKFDAEAILNACLTHPVVHFGEKMRTGAVQVF